jgi:DNA-binding CsgD family transcriptional regulator
MNFVYNSSAFARPFFDHSNQALSPAKEETLLRSDASQTNLFEEWIENDTTDRLLVDRQGKIIWCRLSKGKYDAQHPIHAQIGQLRVGNVLPADFLLPILNAGALSQGAQNRIALIEGTKSKCNLVARVVALGDAKQGPLGVTLLSFNGFGEDQKEDLKRIWDLSDAETRVLAMTLRGMTIQEVATLSETSPETARTHMRHIYVKVGVSSREGLFAALGATVG